MLITILRVLLMLAFVVAGAIKAFGSPEQLKSMMPWTEDVDASVVKGIGYLEILAGLGVALPALTGFWPWLSDIAGAGLITICAGAVWTHWDRKDGTMDMVIPAIIGLLAVIVTFFG